MPELSPAATEAVDRLDRLAFSPGEAAALLGITRPTLYKILNDGSLPSVRVGRRRLISRRALENLLGAEEVAS